MKVLLIGPRWVGGWLEGVERGVHAFGHDVIVFPYDTPSAPNSARIMGKVRYHVPKILHNIFMPLAQNIGSAWERRMNQRLISVSNFFKPDIVLILKGEGIQESTIEALRAPHRRIISWWLDDPILYFQSSPQVLAQVKLVDALFIFDRGHFSELKSLGVSHLIYLPCAVDPLVYHPKRVNWLDRKRFKCEIGLVANYYPGRGALLRYLQGLDISIWGMDWKKPLALGDFPSAILRGKSLSGAEAATVYNVAQICPNVHHFQSRLGGLNMRTFEIPAAGGFELVDNIPGLENLFEIGSEIVAYNSPEHCRELADYYLAHPKERDMIVERGRKRVIRDHTYSQRLEVIFKTLQHMQ